MGSMPFGILCSVAAMVFAAPALAASDYFLVIDGVEGETSSAARVESWSWGQTNSGGSVALDSGPKVTASQNTQSLREAPSRKGDVKLTASQNSQSLREAPSRKGDVKLTASQNGQSLREADFANLAQLDEVSGFTLALASSDAARKICASGKHIEKAHLVKADGIVYDLVDLVIGSCDSSGGTIELRIASGKAREFKGHVTLLK